MMSLPECAAELGVSRRFLEMEIKRGRLRAIKLSTQICRVLCADLDSYVNLAATQAAA